MYPTKTKRHPATHSQRVDITLVVAVEGTLGQYDMPVRDLQAQIETYVRGLLPENLRGATIEVSAQRGPSGSRFFFPGQPIEDQPAGALRVKVGAL